MLQADLTPLLRRLGRFDLLLCSQHPRQIQDGCLFRSRVELALFSEPPDPSVNRPLPLGKVGKPGVGRQKFHPTASIKVPRPELRHVRKFELHHPPENHVAGNFEVIDFN